MERRSLDFYTSDSFLSSTSASKTSSFTDEFYSSDIFYDEFESSDILDDESESSDIFDD